MPNRVRSNERRLNPHEIVQRLERMLDMLESKNVEYEKLGVERAQKEREFNIAFAKKQAKMKHDGTPVGMLKAAVLGETSIANLKLEMDTAEAKVNACRESLRSMKESMGTLRSFLTWLRMEYESQNIPRTF